MSDQKKDEREVKVPMHLLEALRPSIEALGHTVPELDKLVPKIDLGLPVRDMGIRLGALLKNCGLYRKGARRKLVAIFDDEGWKEMTPHRFCGWVEKFVTCYKIYSGAKGSYYNGETSMGKDLAAKIIETDDFLGQLPVIDRVVNVRLPVRSLDGKTVELLKPGYNAEHRIWCEDAVQYDLDMSTEDAVKVWEEMCGEFMFAELKRDVPGALWVNRSFMVHLAASVGVFAQLLFEPGTFLPCIIYVANDRGAGKSLLGCMALASAFGVSTAATLPMSKGNFLNLEKFEAMLETIAQEMKGYLFLDDAPENVFSLALNSFISRPRHTGRKYGGNDEMFDVPNVTQVFMSGMNIETSKDIMQRALWCELFLPCDAESMKHTVNMTPSWLGAPAQRSRFLAALWCMMRAWVAEGMKHSGLIKHRAPLWSGVVGGIIEAFELAAEGKIVTVNPFAVPDLPLAGERGADEMQQLLVALANDVEEDYSIWLNDTAEDRGPWKAPGITTGTVVDKARDMQLIVDVVGSAEDKPLKGSELRKLGRRLEKWRGKEDLRTSTGKRFRFGHRRQKSGTVYPIEWID